MKDERVHNMVKVLQGVKFKMNSINKDIDDLLKMMSKEYGLDIVLEP
jgi:hypothetical protein